jgi:hypothetical protein
MIRRLYCSTATTTQMLGSSGTFKIRMRVQSLIDDIGMEVVSNRVYDALWNSNAPNRRQRSVAPTSAYIYM